MPRKYRFTTHEDIQGRFVKCPKCSELLSPADLDTYNCCPYCNYVLERNSELDDFVVEPMVQNWLSVFNNARPDGRRQH